MNHGKCMGLEATLTSSEEQAPLLHATFKMVMTSIPANIFIAGFWSRCRFTKFERSHNIRAAGPRVVPHWSINCRFCWKQVYVCRNSWTICSIWRGVICCLKTRIHIVLRLNSCTSPDPRRSIIIVRECTNRIRSIIIYARPYSWFRILVHTSWPFLPVSIRIMLPIDEKKQHNTWIRRTTGHCQGEQ